MNEYFSYVITANDFKTFVVKSPLPYHELCEHVENISIPTPCGNHTSILFGTAEFIDPVVMLSQDYLNKLPIIIE